MRSYKLIHFYQPRNEGQEPSRELFNLINDPNEINNLYNNPEYRNIKATLEAKLQ